MNSKMLVLTLFLGTVALATSFRSNQQADVLTNAYLRDLIHQWGTNNEGDAYSSDYVADSYDDTVSRSDDSEKEYEENKALDLLQQRLQRPSLSLRDQEYLQHSSLFSKTHTLNEDTEGSKDAVSATKIAAAMNVKTPGTVLPAYCNPPNPCPVGYTADDGCLEDFENTAAFSRAYQAAQDCMCDMEHMFDCPEPHGKGENNKQQVASANMVNTAIRKIMSEIQGVHKSLVSKKFHNDQLLGVDVLGDLREQAQETMMSAANPEVNPYLQGEKLPVAAKKGGVFSVDK